MKMDIDLKKDQLSKESKTDVFPSDDGNIILPENFDIENMVSTVVGSDLVITSGGQSINILFGAVFVAMGKDLRLMHSEQQSILLSEVAYRDEIIPQVVVDDMTISDDDKHEIKSLFDIGRKSSNAIISEVLLDM